MLSILNLTKTNKLILAAATFLAVVAFGGGRAHAATIDASGGCTLDQSLKSVQNASNVGGCVAVGSYGSNDTVNIPAGTITLSADLQYVNRAITIKGAGMGSTTIDGNNGQYAIFDLGDGGNGGKITISDLRITAFKDTAMYIGDTSLALENVEIDGANSVGNLCGVIAVLAEELDYTVDASNVYIHNFNGTSSGYVEGMNLGVRNGNKVDVNLSNTTISDLHNTGGGVNGLIVSAGYPGNNGGTVNANISNTTVHDLTSSSVVAAFAGFGTANGADAHVNTVINNMTITGMRGSVGSGLTAGFNSAAFSAVGFAIGGGDQADVHTTVSNSLMADNLTDGTPSNCFTGNLNSNVSGVGTVNPSITSGGHNISDDASCTSFTQTGDQQNVANIISTLGPLQNNGGAVPTRALLAGSPAIASGGSVLGVTTDARGVARPGDCPSVGAYQFEGAVCGASTPSASGGSNAGAPNTGVGSVAQILNVLASMLGIGLLTYVFRKQQRTS